MEAQRPARITGVVRQATTQRPLDAAQVDIPGTGLGALTNVQGRFLLDNVPPGEHTVRVTMVGYAARQQTVTVA